MTCDEATRELPYKYGLSIPTTTGVEEIWKHKDFDFYAMSSGCGTNEYLFRSKYVRSMAEKIFIEQFISTFVIED